jgi:hypothetical protein
LGGATGKEEEEGGRRKRQVGCAFVLDGLAVAAGVQRATVRATKRMNSRAAGRWK